MAHTSRRYRLIVTGLALAALVGGSSLCVARQIAMSKDRQLAGADKAALAALHAMIGRDGQLDGGRTKAATEAASRVVASVGATMVSIKPSPEKRSLSVVLLAGENLREAATAHYVPPGEAVGHRRVALLAEQ